MIKYLLILIAFTFAEPKPPYVENSSDTIGYFSRDSLYWKYDKYNDERIYSKNYSFRDTFKIEILGEDTILSLYNDTLIRSIRYESSDAYDFVNETYVGFVKKEDYVRKMSYCDSEYTFASCPYVEHLLFQKDTTTIIDTCYYSNGKIKEIINYKEKEKFFYPEEHRDSTKYDNLIQFNRTTFDKKGNIIKVNKLR